jgi:hypothetical protein
LGYPAAALPRRRHRRGRRGRKARWRTLPTRRRPTR